MPNIKHVCASETKGGLKRAVNSVCFQVGYGIEGDAHAEDWHRQISLLSSEDIKSLGQSGLKPGVFAENIVIDGLDFMTIGVGSKIRLGKDVVLAVTQTGKTLHLSENIVRVSGDYIMARSGLFARVEQGGKVSAGDEVELLEVVARDRIQAVVLTISDRCSRGETIDTAGPAVVKLAEESLNAHVSYTEIIPDDKEAIAAKLKHYCDDYSIDIIFTAGGTGPAPRDITPEATRSVVERLTPGFDEAMRFASLAKTPTAILSRGVSGIRKQTFIVNLPGSERAAVENLEAIIKALPHGVKKLRGHPADCGCCSKPRIVKKEGVAQSN